MAEVHGGGPASHEILAQLQEERARRQQVETALAVERSRRQNLADNLHRERQSRLALTQEASSERLVDAASTSSPSAIHSVSPVSAAAPPGARDTERGTTFVFNDSGRDNRAGASTLTAAPVGLALAREPSSAATLSRGNSAAPSSIALTRLPSDASSVQGGAPLSPASADRMRDLQEQQRQLQDAQEALQLRQQQLERHASSIASRSVANMSSASSVSALTLPRRAPPVLAGSFTGRSPFLASGRSTGSSTGSMGASLRAGQATARGSAGGAAPPPPPPPPFNEAEVPAMRVSDLVYLLQRYTPVRRGWGEGEGAGVCVGGGGRGVWAWPPNRSMPCQARKRPLPRRNAFCLL